MYRHYYTLPELFIPDVGETIDDFKDPLWAKTEDKGFYTIINHISGLSFTDDDAYTKELMQKYVWPEMWDAKVIYLDTCKCEKPVDVDTIKLLRKQVLGSIYSWINDTYFVYTDRIKAAENVDLMGDIKSETFNRFNDTPQASSTGFDDDAHATNTTKTITSSAGGTAASRLSEVYSFIRNQYKLWADEFIQKFTIIE